MANAGVPRPSIAAIATEAMARLARPFMIDLSN
jgi:hypothetical protein